MVRKNNILRQVESSAHMIFSKFYCLTTFHKRTTVIIRQYAEYRFFRPLIMPKDNKEYLMELQKQRKRLKAQSAKYTPTHIYLQVLSNGTRAESRSLLLVTDHTNYLFNCGEGTQRLAAEHHAKLAKIEHIFVTSATWENMGGIPGVALTIQDTGVPKLNLHGPNGSIDIIEATQNFITLNQLAVTAQDTTSPFSDQTMSVTYLPIKSPKPPAPVEEQSSRIIVDNTNYYDYRVNSNGKRSHSPPSSPSQRSRSASLEDKSRIDHTMVYICKVHPKTGTLDMAKCVDAGVTPGPHLGKLKAGEDITLPDGRVIKSKDVVSPSQIGPLFIVLECPDEDWIDVIVENPAFLKYQEGTAKIEEEIARYIIHFSTKNVLENPKYKDWMRKFGSKTQHLIINEENKGYCSEAMHKMQHQLHLIHPDIFPFLGENKNFAEHNPDADPLKKIRDKLKSIEENSEQSENEASKTCETTETDVSVVQNDGLFIHQCQTLNTVHLRPNTGLDKTSIVRINPKEYIQDVFAVDGFLDTLADLQTQLNAKTKPLGNEKVNVEEYPRLVMLGTGSSIPNKVRNTSGILFQVNEDTSIILDCGEATMGQIIRFFGVSEADRVLKSIKAVYVSHLHADHHLGLVGILQQRKRLTDEPLFLLAPRQISWYLNYYHSRFEPIQDLYRLISNRDLLLNQTILSSATSKALYDQLGIANISTINVTHCPFAYGIAITLNDGRKTCYSGDTIPCENMVKLAKDSFLLIHEATMEDGLEQEAVLKRHSTISQAVSIGVKANVNFTLLTHFSQRYSKMPRLPSVEQSGIDFARVGIAFDFMKISFAQLKLLPLFYPSLNLMFSEFKALLDERASKREWTKEKMVKTAS
ncbi:hypothetical protein TSAR_013862 [Trichomalopsis sarcophagae]|uniref:Zinc phosphodiesterase ELAC protein 2 n=1 Tax=Trichomalopsis sarcophagae TaxID=543379 RepID=A0A232ENG6_9HYME|nr:hypothetical protein TSAR_013862 [Trichomalopsis sarcophagae]